MPKTEFPDDVLAEVFASLPVVEQLCPMGRILRDASPRALDLINAALAADRKRVPNEWIVAQLRTAGIPINKDSVSRHRNGRCRCRVDA